MSRKRTYTAEQKAAGKERQRAYYARNKSRIQQRNREWHAKRTADNPNLRRENHLRLRYGITEDDFARMLFHQNGACACCGALKPGGPVNRLNVDHDHATGKIRGLLCFRCNTMIGRVNEDPDVLAFAVLYLERHRKLGVCSRPADAQPPPTH